MPPLRNGKKASMKQLRREVEALRKLVTAGAVARVAMQKQCDDFSVIAQRCIASMQIMVQKGHMTNEEILDKFNTNAKAIKEAATKSQGTGTDDSSDSDERPDVLEEESSGATTESEG